MIITDEFMELLREEVHKLSTVYSPVSLFRLYPFLVSHFPARMAEGIMIEAERRGIVGLVIIKYQYGKDEERSTKSYIPHMAAASDR
jgi:hypothetical protein